MKERVLLFLFVFTTVTAELDTSVTRFDSRLIYPGFHFCIQKNKTVHRNVAEWIFKTCIYFME
jgi:hypothetical protein